MRRVPLIALVAAVVAAGFLALPSSCSTAAADARATAAPPVGAPGPRLFDGVGSYRRPYACASDLARRFADQGLVLVYGFNHDEAIRSFEEAVRLDPNCGFAWWGLAYACGPHINNPKMTEARAERAAEAALRAVAATASVDDAIRDLARAVAARYARPAPSDRRLLDEAFAAAMREARRARPDDVDVGCVYAESLMNLRPWDLWTADGSPHEGTEEIVATLEDVLRRRPDHPGANHAYIHAVEASRDPGRAAAAADRLRDAVPVSGHLVHMPSHIDVRLGRYAAAAEANRRAIAADRRYVALVGPGGLNDLYRAHNVHFLAYACLFEGRYAEALAAARALIAEIPPASIDARPEILDSFVDVPFHVFVRFGRWDEILAEPEPPPARVTATAIRRYARGIALAARGDVPAAEAEAAAFETAAARIPEGYSYGNNPTSAIVAVARAMLGGEIAFRRGDDVAAFRLLAEAAERVDALKYDEPWGWMTPPRHALGALLLERGRAAEAEAVYRADLARNPENGWALHGLAEALATLGRDAEADDVRRRFERAWARADTALTASCFCRRVP